MTWISEYINERCTRFKPFHTDLDDNINHIEKLTSHCTLVNHYILLKEQRKLAGKNVLQICDNPNPAQ